MKFDELCSSILNERKHPYTGGIFTSPAELVKYINIQDGKVTVKDSAGKPVQATIEYSPQDPKQQVSINWQENGEDYGIDLSKSDKDYAYEVVEDETGEWLDVEWFPGEKVQIKV